MLARLVYREANIESLECQMAVTSVIINRWRDGRWGDTLEDVIYSPYQFTPANLLYQTTPTELNYTAVDLVLQNGCTLEPYVMYFRADHHFDWDGYKPYTQIDYTCFGYFETDR
jgi:spore germination cell wall hydrolase CwlJ-like protein